MRLNEHRRLFRYDSWANRETAGSVVRADPAPPAATRRLAHIVGAERLWLSRLRGEKSPMAVWPDLSVQECQREAESLSAAWQTYLDELSELGLGRLVSYVNSKGEPWKSSVDDVLTHVGMHSAYHRGQIASDLRAAGFEPPYTDFIHAVRQGFVR